MRKKNAKSAQSMEIGPLDLIPPHAARTPKLLADLVEAMKENGWQGRPLIVVETAGGYQAWTGSHRIAAARRVGLSSVPCYVIRDAGLAAISPTFDYERLTALRALRDEAAIRLMWLEGRE